MGSGKPVVFDSAENALNTSPPKWRNSPSAIKERTEFLLYKNNKSIGIVVGVIEDLAIYSFKTGTNSILP